MKKRAFTLIELMIVVAIIGILAAIAIPNFVKFQCRSKQSEAKGNLKALYVAQEAYRSERDIYAGCTASGATGTCAATNMIGFSPKGKSRYSYQVSAANATEFDASASAAAGAIADEQDVWSIDEANLLVNSTNACD